MAPSNWHTIAMSKTPLLSPRPSASDNQKKDPASIAGGKMGNAPGNTRGNKRIKNEPPRAWQRMLSGRRLDILDPSPMDIEIEDIAHGLARVSRWNGQTKGKFPLSVAQHSIIVEKLLHQNAPKLEQKWRLAALLHDAPEYVIGDMITPFKHTLGGSYRDIENRLEAAVHIRFGLPAALPEPISRSIKRADRMAAWLEATQLAGFSVDEALKIFVKPSGTPAAMRIRPMAPDEAATAFLRRFSILGGTKKPN
jgi:5'-deoxynucleotidase YfbR-like HD superfamily hydrolase